MELKLITTALIQRYIVTSAPNFRRNDMDMKDHFLALPKGERCDLEFSHVDQSLVKKRAERTYS